MGNKVIRARVVKPLRHVFMGGVSTLAVAALAAPALAEDQSAPIVTAANVVAPVAAQEQSSSSSGSNPTTVQEVVVTGLRGSLQKSLNIKRDAVGVVDAVSAEDIGKFPDSSLAVAMERIPGVSVSYGASALGGVPTSTGSATEITVRGFGPGFNETLYDGRQVSSALANRGFDFSAVGSDFVQEIDVLKTPDASLSSGAIGATINIQFPKPLDHPGPHLSGSYSESYSPEDGHATPNGSVFMSDTFANDTIGVLADFSYSDKKTRGDHVNNQGWVGTPTVANGSTTSGIQQSQYAGTAPAVGSTNWFTQDYGIYQEFNDDQRVDGRAVLQWRPTGNVLFTLNDDYSRDDIREQQYGQSFWFNAGNLTNITRAPNGTITSFIQPNSPTDFQGQINGSVLETNDIGFNAKWDVNDHFKVAFDADHSESWLNPGGQYSTIDADVGYGPSGTGGTNGVNFGIVGIGAGQVPYPSAYGPGGNTAEYNEAAIIGSHVFPLYEPQNYDSLNQFKLDGTWTEDNLKLNFGVQYVNDHYRLKEYDDQQNDDWQAYAGYGPASNNAGGVALPASLFTSTFSTSGFLNGYNTGGLPAQILKVNPQAVMAYLQGLGNPKTKTIPGFNTSDTAYAGQYGVALNPGLSQDIDQKTYSLFLNTQYKATLADRPLTVDLGVRAEETRTESGGLGAEVTGFAVQPSDLTAYQTLFATNAAGQNIYTPESAGNNYHDLLPNLDLNWMVLPKLKLRFDASRTLTQPNLNYLSPSLVVPTTERVGALTATSGNTQLQPYTSDNLDLGAEWYYKKNSYVSIDGFIKDISNYIVAGTVQESINNVKLPNGSVANFVSSSYVNGPSAEVKGVELAWQYMFGETGFGYQANASFVETNKPYNPNDLTSAFALPGLANSANLVAFYDKSGFQARVAVNWRGSYLDHFGQQQNTSGYSIEPTFVDAATYVDFSTSYEINSHLSIYFDALNLTDQTYATHGRFSNQVLDIVDTGRMFNLGFHFKM